MEPLSLVTGANFAGEYISAGQNDRALEQARKTYDLEPNHPTGRLFLGVVYVANGMNAQAIALGEKDLQNDQTDQDALYFTG